MQWNWSGGTFSLGTCSERACSGVTSSWSKLNSVELNFSGRICSEEIWSGVTCGEGVLNERTWSEVNVGELGVGNFVRGEKDILTELIK